MSTINSGLTMILYINIIAENLRGEINERLQFNIHRSTKSNDRYRRLVHGRDFKDGVVIMLSKDGGSIVAKYFKRRGAIAWNVRVTRNLMHQKFRKVFTQPDAMVK